MRNAAENFLFSCNVHRIKILKSANILYEILLYAKMLQKCWFFFKWENLSSYYYIFRYTSYKSFNVLNFENTIFCVLYWFHVVWETYIILPTRYF